MHALRRRYGDTFTVNLPIFGRAVVISTPADIRRLLTAGHGVVDNIEPNLGRVLGSGSIFALSGQAHLRQRKLLVPPFHGRRLAAYERIVEEETVREMAAWPRGRSFPVLPSTMRITLNVILRAVFGAEGTEFTRLRAMLPRAIVLGSLLAAVPVPRVDWGRWSPWGRFRLMRREYDELVDGLIARAEREARLDERDDILALMLQARYDDGARMSRDEIADQLLTLLAAGHETTATSLAWAVERLRRHPAVLDALVREVDAGGSALREAVISEVQRTRPVVDLFGRRVTAETFELGPWRLPRGTLVLASIALVHDDDAVFPNAAAFDPSRFVGTRPDPYQLIPFGGGTRRCLGAAFATMEMNVVLRTMLRDVTLLPTTERGERWHFRGVASAPADGGRAIIQPRRATEGGA
jgi:cytochrome P450